MMEILRNTTITFTNRVVNTFLPVQGYGSAINNMDRINPPRGMGFSTQQMPNVTTNSTIVLRHQIDVSNHDMVHMLAQ